jgi:peptidoglycan/LPS O-acetylase OafA/YrhL
MSARTAIPATAQGYFRFDRAASSIDALDGLRGIAVLLVLLRHAAFPVAEQAGRPVWAVGGYDLAIPLINGWIGVDLFFVLSGFLIASHLLRNFDSPNSFSWKRYLAQRFLRIVPTYWFVLALAVMGAIPFFAVGPQSLGIRTAYHLLLLQDYLPPNIVVAFWSLGVEEKFYLLAPAIVAAALWPRRFGHRILVLGLFVAAPVLSRSVQAAQMGGGIDYTAFARVPLFITALMRSPLA